MQSPADSLTVLMHAYKIYQDQKTQNSITNVESDTDLDTNTCEHRLTEAYQVHTSTARNSDSQSKPFFSRDLLEEAVSFCQQRNNDKREDTTSTASPVMRLSKQSAYTEILKPVPRSISPKNSRHDNFAAVNEVKDLSINDDTNTEDMTDIVKTSSNSFRPVMEKPSQGKVTLVQKEGMTYTRIGPPRAFAPSPDSAFRSTAPVDGVEGKRLKIDPGLRHLQDPTKSRLSRSTSVPVTYPEGEENTPPHHRVLHRTGSFVSTSTKLKLKSAILAKTSAALVRKPSITDFEMMQIQADPDADDSDSSQSEDEDEAEVPESSPNLRKRKLSDDRIPPPVSTNEHSPMIPPHQPSVITTAGST